MQMRVIKYFVGALVMISFNCAAQDWKKLAEDTSFYVTLDTFTPEDSEAFTVKNIYYSNSPLSISEGNYLTGEKFFRRFYINNNLQGVSYSWYKEGNIRSFDNYIVGCRVGLSMQWYENGNLKSIGTFWTKFEDDRTITKNPSIEDTVRVQNLNDFPTLLITTKVCGDVRDGIWKYYSENGILQKEELWKKGSLMK